MRKIHTQISLITGTAEIKPDEGLFDIGERYLRNKRFARAKYIFSRYLELYPRGKDAEKAAKNLHIAEIGAAQAAQQEPPEKFNAGKAYYNAVNLIKTGNNADAMRIFTEVAASEDTEWAVKGVYEIGRCLFFLNRYEDCIKHYQNMFEKFPKHQDIKDAMFYVGQACEKTGKKDIAADWYKKIIAMPSADNDKTRAKTVQALDALGR
jgi:TolA-binding protein